MGIFQEVFKLPDDNLLSELRNSINERIIIMGNGIAGLSAAEAVKEGTTREEDRNLL